MTEASDKHANTKVIPEEHGTYEIRSASLEHGEYLNCIHAAQAILGGPCC